MNQKILVLLTAGLIAFAGGCTSNSDDSSAGTQHDADAGSTSSIDVTAMQSSKGVGPISEVKLAPLDTGMAARGKEVFAAKCSACHKIETHFVGPALRGVTKRRQPEWIMNMILNPAEMTQKDPVAKELLAQHLTQMTFQNVTQDQARLILEFFRSNDSAAR